METSKRARKRKPDTAKANLKPLLCSTPEGRESTREVESEGPGEKYRAVIDGGNPVMNRSAHWWGKVEPGIPLE
jgi:hypothetical protein